MSVQASGVFGVGTEPPPDSSDPSRQVATSEGSPVTAPRSAWVICPTFSSSVIWASRSSARVAGSSDRSIHGRCGGDDPAAGPAAASVMVIRSQVPTAPRRMDGALAA